MSPTIETTSSSPITTTNRVRTRGLRRVTWSVQEKEIMYACYSYLRSERWCRNKTREFQEELRKSSLNQSKLEEMTPRKLDSLMSQISNYVNAEKLTEIRSVALQEAERDFERESVEEKGRRKPGWLLEEKWTLLWATEYAKKKI